MGEEEVARAAEGEWRSQYADLIYEKFADRRGHYRFSASFRAEYVVADRNNISFVSNLSRGGMLLRSADALEHGTSYGFLLRLDDGGDSVTLTGTVCEEPTRNARIAFDTGQSVAEARLREYIEGFIVPKLEKDAL